MSHTFNVLFSGRYIVFNAEINNSPVIHVNYDAPNYGAEQVKPFEDLTSIFNQLNFSGNAKCIWGGDFILTFDINLYADGGIQSFIKIYFKALIGNV